ncbi:hypothetical protein ACWDWO_00400 [Actinopolymorpha singaporensis]|uniref:Uncharacterized protein n=1 Tax=Actinopolymorpha singaporensis TaxID=117157 RepID=A0A1H1LKP3_9ACTN|nr:hypothetical protein [Actinopolymorpha singaporensis]SDR75116.1 hypothetical protein SAMN04489717_0399 [Actinopolymorpha singaporensis]
MKLNMIAVYRAPGYSRRQLVVCCEEMLQELRASETRDPSVGHATVHPDLQSGSLEVVVQAEGDTYDAAADRAARRLDQAVTAVTRDSPAALEELHSELWCRRTTDKCRTRADQEASRARPTGVEARRGTHPYAQRNLALRLVGMCGFAASAILAVSAVQHGGLDMLLIIGAALSAMLAAAAWTYLVVADVKACVREPRRPEDADR